MSKAAVRKNQADILNQMKKDRKDIFAQRRQISSALGSVNVGNLATNSGGGSGGGLLNVNIESSPNTNALLKTGDSMEGPLAFKPNSITISGGKLTMSTVLLSTPTSWCIATGEGSAVDDLDNIITQYNGGDQGALFSGQILILQAGVYNITLKHNTGNIFIPSGSDVTLNGYTSGGGGSGGDIAVLIFDNQVVDTSSGKWVLVSTSTGSGGSGFVNPATTDLDMNTYDITDICRLEFNTSSTDDIGATVTGIDADNVSVGINKLQFNVGGTTDYFEYTINGGMVFKLQSTSHYSAKSFILADLTSIYANSSDHIGFHVTDATTVGTKGTVEIPYDESTAFPSGGSGATALSGLFGDDNGSIGVYEDTNATINYRAKFYYKSDDGWYQISGTKV